MRHGFAIGYGNYTGWANGGTIFLILLVIAVTILIALNRDHSKKKHHPEYNKLMEILKEKYLTNEISAHEYRERSMLIEDEFWFDLNNPAMMILKERYAKCDIDSREYVERREELKGRSNKSALDVLKERYARGELSSEEFQLIKTEIQ